MLVRIPPCLRKCSLYSNGGGTLHATAGQYLVDLEAKLRYLEYVWAMFRGGEP
jgi:hypothetical protein